MKFIKIAVSCVLLIYVFNAVELDWMFILHNNLSYNYFVFSAILISLTLLVGSLRWQTIISHFGVDTCKYKLCRIFVRGNFWGQVLPGGGLGGDPIRVLQLNYLIQNKSLSIKSVILDRFSGLIINILISSAIAYYFIKREIFDFKSDVLLFVDYFMPVLMIIIVIYCYWRHRLILITSIYSMLIFIAIGMAFYMCAIGLNTEINFWHCAFLFCIANVAKAFPFSVSGWGIREFVSLSLAPLLDLDEGVVLSVSVYYGVTVMLTAFFCWFVEVSTDRTSRARNFQKINQKTDQP
ncbi:flippase-like domain-containing protein [Paracoccaceae bacterium]|nr:flippase-like domain-containing protein [Paracoccaceae bacterium]